MQSTHKYHIKNQLVAHIHTHIQECIPWEYIAKFELREQRIEQMQTTNSLAEFEAMNVQLKKKIEATTTTTTTNYYNNNITTNKK